MTTQRNPFMALVEAVQFLLGEVAQFDMDPTKVAKASALKAELDELQAYELEMNKAEQERVAFFDQLNSKPAFDVETGKGSLLAGAVDLVKDAISGEKKDPAAQ